MGHVNQRLVVVKTSESPETIAGTEVFAAGNPEKAVGKITSSARNHASETIALAMIRVTALKADVPLQTATGIPMDRLQIPKE